MEGAVEQLHSRAHTLRPRVSGTRRLWQRPYTTVQSLLLGGGLFGPRLGTVARQTCAVARRAA